MLRALLLALPLVAPLALRADPPVITDVEARKSDMGWQISVTIEHPDSGWDHYADGWEVLDEAGNRLGFRELHHPHVNEQPFTRSLHSLMVPDGTRMVYVRAYCSRNNGQSKLHKVRLER